MKTWKLKRVRQCQKCPWKVGVDPNDIPNGYTRENHEALACTIAEPASLSRSSVMRVMSCHEHDTEEQVHCVGWLHHQLGRGNNIALRMHMLSCENVGALRVDGEQHQSFEDTLPPQ